MRSLRAAALLVVLTMAGCASPGPEVLDPVGTVPGAELVTVFVATNRERQGDDGFTPGRAEGLRYLAYTISIPPTHETSNIEWPRHSVDPRTDFAVVEERTLGETDFQSAIAASSRSRDDTAIGSVGVFVHGYNYSFTESLFRLAQLSADAEAGGTPVLFAWPSEGSLTGYVADKEAATYSRDHLVELLGALTRQSGTGRVTVAAHSMGAWLTVEALRQLRLTGQDRVFRRLGRIILAAPDIEVAVFRQQMKVIGRMDPPMTVLVSPYDRALAASRTLAGGRPRLGTVDVSDPAVEALAYDSHVQIIDISSLPPQDPMYHEQYVTLAGFIANLGGHQREKLTGLAGQAGASVLGTIGSTLAGPFVWGAEVLSR